MGGQRGMNYLLIPTVLVAGLLFVPGAWLGRRNPDRVHFYSMCGLGVILATPGAVFAAYYLKVFGEPIWLYQFRSIPFTEVTAGGSGFLAGLLHGRYSSNEQFRRIAGGWFFPGILILGLVVPYLKPVVRPPNWTQFQDRWAEGVCFQTSESSCGPACAATLVRRFGKTATEQEIAKASFTSRNGTENWYLARTLRGYGLQVGFTFEPDSNKPWPVPAIAGVRLPTAGNTGHFITVLDREGDKYIIGDPLAGRIVRSQSELHATYEFTGFLMAVK